MPPISAAKRGAAHLSWRRAPPAWRSVPAPSAAHRVGRRWATPAENVRKLTWGSLSGKWTPKSVDGWGIRKGPWAMGALGRSVTRLL